MIIGRKLYLKSVITIIMALSLWFIVLDFSRFSSLDYTYDIPPGGVLKRLCVLMASLIAWTVGSKGLCLQDSRFMSWAFIFACLGETAFLLRSTVIGMVMFSICQLLLIVRNGTGFEYSLKHSTVMQKRILFILVIIISLIFMSGVLLSFLFTELSNTLFVVLIYWGILNLSLWAALACTILRLLPAQNAALAAAGIICFFCCDILVGLDRTLEPGLPWLLSNSFIWIFYIPALVLLALSCYDYS